MLFKRNKKSNKKFKYILTPNRPALQIDDADDLIEDLKGEDK